MNMEILCFAAGIAAYYLKSFYPVMGLLLALWFRWKTSLWVGFILGFSWAYLHQLSVSTPDFSTSPVLKQAELQGVIVSIPKVNHQKIQFQFLVHHINQKPTKTLVQLACYDHCPSFHAGETWQLVAKLKKPQNLGNPGSMDYRTSLQARHIQWIGYIHRGTARFISKASSLTTPMLHLRAALAEILKKMDNNPHIIGLIEALTLGIGQDIDAETWDLFRRTGTTHLMVISGAHIGLIAGLSYTFLKWIWCRCHYLPQHMPAQRIASLGGIIMAFLYALLAGFGVPAQRACIAFSLLSIRYFSNYRITIWQAWLYGLCSVLIFEPHAVLQPGFYLSFIAVAILIAMNQRLNLNPFKKTLCLQLSCLFGLMPLTLFWFSYGSLNGFFANLIAIPWVSFIIIPLGLCLTLLGTWVPMGPIIFLEKYAIQGLLTYLHWIDSYSNFNIIYTIDNFLALMSLMLVISVSVFIPIKPIMPILVLIAASSLLPSRQTLPAGEVAIDILDVGQGLAISVRTQHHTLVYDTGIKFYQGTDMGQMVLIPYFRAKKISKIDKVVISHPDLDHRGGLKSLGAVLPIHELLVDDPKQYRYAQACHEYPDWTWDGIQFHFFAIPNTLNHKNNRSCVLRIANAAGAVLLTGDIERAAEQYLVTTYGSKLTSQVILVPHHGSKTSSTPEFIESVSPQYAIASYGFDNRYHFPHDQAMQTYSRYQIPVFSTESCGYIQVKLRNSRRLEVYCSKYHK